MVQDASSVAAAEPSGRGAFIVFEGVDRCGKTTQSKLLEEHLRNHNIPVERWSFPDRSTFIGQCINTYLQDSSVRLDPVAVHHLFVANRHEKRAALVAALRSGTTIIVDRYSYSGLAYSTAKGLAGLSHQFCRTAEAGLPAADVVLYMRLSAEALRQRGGFGEERYENVEMQTKVIQSFEALHDATWREFDASQSIDAIHEQVVEVVQRVMEESRTRPVSRLWDGLPYAELADKVVASEPDAMKENTTAAAEGAIKEIPTAVAEDAELPDESAGSLPPPAKVARVDGPAVLGDTTNVVLSPNTAPQGSGKVPPQAVGLGDVEGAHT